MAHTGWGSIRKLRSGRFQARYTDSSGLRQVAPDTFGTRRDAERWLAAKRTDMARGVDVDERGSRQPLSHWWAGMHADHGRRLKPSTVKYYRELWQDLIEPTFGPMPVGRVRPSMVDQWAGDLIDQGVSGSRVKGAAGLLGRMFDAAVRDRALQVNPAGLRTVKVPASAPVDRPVLTPAEVTALQDAAWCVDGKGVRQGREYLPVLVGVLAYGGLRVGEALGLQRRDVDVQAGTVRVRRSVSEIDGRQYITGTKTGRERVVTLPTAVVDQLKVWLRSVSIAPDAPVFPSDRGKVWRYSNLRRRVWLPMVERWNARRVADDLPVVEVLPHDLRSCCASLLIDAGASPKDVQQHLGHADISTTMNLYARVRPGRAESLAEVMHTLITGTS